MLPHQHPYPWKKSKLFSFDDDLKYLSCCANTLTFKSENTRSSFVWVFMKKMVSHFQLSRESFWSLLVIYILAILVGIFGNGLVLVAVLWRPSMRTPHNFFIAALALSDLFLCAFTMPGKCLLQFTEALFLCAPFWAKKDFVHLFSNSIPSFEKCLETSQTFTRTEQTFVCARSFLGYFLSLILEGNGLFGFERAPSQSQKGPFSQENDCSKWYTKTSELAKSAKEAGNICDRLWHLSRRVN